MGGVTLQYSLCVSGASGEEVHEAGVEVRLCRINGGTDVSIAAVICTEML